MRCVALALAVASLATIGIVGCTVANEDEYSRYIDVARPDREGYTVSDNHATDRLSVGMTRAEVERVAGSSLEKRDDKVWLLPHQRGGRSLFGSVSVKLYFDDDRLAAIITTGSYLLPVLY